MGAGGRTGNVGKDLCEIKTQNFLKRLFELSLGGGGAAENVNGVKVEGGVIVSYTHFALHTPVSVPSCTANST